MGAVWTLHKAFRSVKYESPWQPEPIPLTSQEVGFRILHVELGIVVFYSLGVVRYRCSVKAASLSSEELVQSNLPPHQRTSSVSSGVRGESAPSTSHLVIFKT